MRKTADLFSIGVVCAEASALLYANRVEDARRILLTQFVGDHPTYRRDVPSYQRAMIALANADQNDDPIKWLLLALPESRTPEDKADILLKIGQYHYLRATPSDNSAAKLAFERLQKTISTTAYRYRAAGQYLAGLAQRQ